MWTHIDELSGSNFYNRLFRKRTFQKSPVVQCYHGGAMGGVRWAVDPNNLDKAPRSLLYDPKTTI